MLKRIGAVSLAVAMCVGGVATTPTMAAEATGLQKHQATAADVYPRRHDYFRHRYTAYRPYYPYYYGRPSYYSPGPLFLLPVPPLWGYGWEWY